jgi:hypothetical protein
MDLIRPRRIDIFLAFFRGAMGGLLLEFSSWFTIMVVTNPTWETIPFKVWAGLIVGYGSAIGFLLLGLFYALRIMYTFYPGKTLKKFLSKEYSILNDPLWPFPNKRTNP